MISHRDLLSAFDRLFRRIGVKVSMSEGFHPRPRMSFPLSLAVGVRGLDEVFELEIDDPPAVEELLASFRNAAPQGLVFTSMEYMPPGSPKLGIIAAEYEIEIPAERLEGFANRVREFLESETYTVERDYREQTLNVRAGVETLELDEQVETQADSSPQRAALSSPQRAAGGAILRMRLRTSNSVAAAKPQEVLAALGIADLLDIGCYLTRTHVALGSGA